MLFSKEYPKATSTRPVQRMYLRKQKNVLQAMKIFSNSLTLFLVLLVRLRKRISCFTRELLSRGRKTKILDGCEQHDSVMYCGRVNT